MSKEGSTKLKVDPAMTKRFNQIMATSGKPERYVASYLGVTVATVNRTLNGKRGLTALEAKQICTLFGISIEWLIFGRGDMKTYERDNIWT